MDASLDRVRKVKHGRNTMSDRRRAIANMVELAHSTVSVGSTAANSLFEMDMLKGDHIFHPERGICIYIYIYRIAGY